MVDGPITPEDAETFVAGEGRDGLAQVESRGHPAIERDHNVLHEHIEAILGNEVKVPGTLLGYADEESGKALAQRFVEELQRKEGEDLLAQFAAMDRFPNQIAPGTIRDALLKGELTGPLADFLNEHREKLEDVDKLRDIAEQLGQEGFAAIRVATRSVGENKLFKNVVPNRYPPYETWRESRLDPLDSYQKFSPDAIGDAMGDEFMRRLLDNRPTDKQIQEVAVEAASFSPEGMQENMAATLAEFAKKFLKLASERIYGNPPQLDRVAESLNKYLFGVRDRRGYGPTAGRYFDTDKSTHPRWLRPEDLHINNLMPDTVIKAVQAYAREHANELGIEPDKLDHVFAQYLESVGGADEYSKGVLAGTIRTDDRATELGADRPNMNPKLEGEGLEASIQPDVRPNIYNTERVEEEE